jgi:hypothetical protein
LRSSIHRHPRRAASWTCKTGSFGVANKRSIGDAPWAGMRLAFTYAGERLEKTRKNPARWILPCDAFRDIDATSSVRCRLRLLDAVVS